MPNQIIKIEISANTVAWYGAIVATITTISFIIFGILGYLKDKPKLKLNVTRGFLMGPNYKDDNDYIFIEGVNKGKRTVTINGAGFILKNKKILIKVYPENINFPFEIKSGKSCQIYFDRKELLKQLHHKKTEIKYAFYRDATNQAYKTKFRLK